MFGFDTQRLGSGLRASLTENAGLKVLSFVFAIGMFAFLHGQQDVQQRTIPVDVLMRLPDSDVRQLTSSVPKNIHITVKGSARAINAVIENRIEPVTIDLRDGSDSEIVFDERMFLLPSDVKITLIDPPSLSLEWQDVVVRGVRLQASITGQPLEGYVVRGEPSIRPPQIQVQGPRGAVEVLQLIRLAAFDVSSLGAGAHRRRIAVESPPNRVAYLDPPSADVTVTIARRTSEARFSKRPVEVVGVEHAVVVPPAVDVIVVGPPEVVRALRADQVVPRVDLAAQAPDAGLPRHGSAVAQVTLDLANTETEIQPPSVTVKW